MRDKRIILIFGSTFQCSLSKIQLLNQAFKSKNHPPKNEKIGKESNFLFLFRIGMQEKELKLTLLTNSRMLHHQGIELLKNIIKKHFCGRFMDQSEF